MADTSNDMPSQILAQTGMLIEALPYMRQYSDQTLVIKFGGHAMGEADYVSAFASDIALLDRLARARSWFMAAAHRLAKC